ncbi:cytosolic protein [Neobacillus thermocopriae]|uniref:Cytosolic protein n=1 Tax=Neobacillus thermocopriae TaxID=1215031 RepID=A0A6B3TQ37_9BACI|nr:cytosolic protein [Neobacillus thermocopriae]MED3624576.1 cytosolic protein [Neobacillus thermocopriae]MED3712969.1 cytosolic protein [Neobacillus thermocopriae]NEX79105.1 cytosolic protein [Neobacillus thermocopriae]
MAKKDSKNYDDLSNVEVQRNFLTAEEFPEGPYGSPIRKDDPVELKSSPWQEGQRWYSNFNYEFKALHQDMPREMDGAHPPHDDKHKDEQAPYNNNEA